MEDLRALACERRHGAKQQGMVGPSLVEALEDARHEASFIAPVFGGRVDKGMPDFSSSTDDAKELGEPLRLSERACPTGKIKPGDLQAIDAK